MPGPYPAGTTYLPSWQTQTVAGSPSKQPGNPVVFTALGSGLSPNTVIAALIGSATLSRSGGTSASASSGQGGWQVTDRTRSKAATEWLDYYPFVLGMQCLLDAGDAGGGTGYKNGIPNQPVDVEPQCTLLERFEEPVPNSYPQQPPILMVQGPVPHTELFWVCSRLSFEGGDGGQIRNAGFGRIQQHFTIELTEYSPTAAIVAQLSPAQAAALPATNLAGFGAVQPSGKTYTVVAGDNLGAVAAKTMGNAVFWTQIALLNGLSNSALLYPGQVLQIPNV